MMEEQKYVSLTELAQEMGLKRSSLYYYLKALHIEARKFAFNKHKYVTQEEAERIKAVKRSPWKVDKEVA